MNIHWNPIENLADMYNVPALILYEVPKTFVDADIIKETNNSKLILNPLKDIFVYYLQKENDTMFLIICQFNN